MGVLLGLGCYIVCLRALRWARLPVFPSLIGAGILALVLYMAMAIVAHTVVSRMLTTPILTICALALVLVLGAAWAGYATAESKAQGRKSPFSIF